MQKPSNVAQHLLTTEVLVVGGGFAGVAAAIAAAKAGRQVCLVESRAYLGWELFATLRPWLTAAEHEKLNELFNWTDKTYTSDSTSGEQAVIPDACKLLLEDVLLAHGVKLLYYAHVIGWEQEEAGCRVEIAGKFGRRYICAKALIDATQDGRLVRCLPTSARRSLAEATPYRTIEFTRVDAQRLQELPMRIPEDITSDFIVHQGHEGSGHLLIEHALPAVADLLSERVGDLDVRAPFFSMTLARWLFEHHPAFAKATLATSSYELTLPPLWRLTGSNNANLAEKCLTPVGEVPLAAFYAQEGLWVASGCADLADDTAQAIATDLITLLQLGTAIGQRCAQSCGELQITRPVATYEPPIFHRAVETLVIGGGTSGASAAITAAETSDTLLVEMNSGLGGTGTIGGVNSYWYGQRDKFSGEVSRLVADEHAWMGIRDSAGRWNVEAKMFALLKAACRANVDIIFRSMLVNVCVNEAGAVTGVVVLTPDGLLHIDTKVTIDATGDGDVAVLAGADYVYGAKRDAATMWYSMAPVTRPGLPRNNWTSSIDMDDVEDITRAVLSARRRWVGHDHSPYIAPRETRHIQGEVCLTLTDQLRMRQWSDVVYVAFSNHDIKGQSGSDWIRLGLIPPNLEIEIPYRAIVPAGIDGVYVVGKAFSATHDGLPAIRMQADLENLGCVAGIAARLCVAEGVTPQTLPVDTLQQRLTQSGMLAESVCGRSVPDSAPELTEADMRHWVSQLNDAVHLYAYSDMEFDEVRRDPIPLVEVCTAGPAIVPILEEELRQSHSPRRITVAKALAWYGSKAATPVLLAEIARHLQGDELPMRDANIRHTQASPDQGAMPELAYLLHALAMTRDERALDILLPVVECLHPTAERFRDNKSGVFHYVDAVCEIAEAIASPQCVPALEQLHDEALFHDKMLYGPLQADYFEERIAYVEVTIGRALARCGAKRGLQILVNYLRDTRRSLVRYAYHELKDITGKSYPPDAARWQAWLTEVDEIAPKPWYQEKGQT
ncbi:FAD-dependent oxidoreductase [Alicyclobacillus fodiniaquatilis]|uniref:FAD-dependent oxidoreductase n=1 Tax=Alicyclobacillus fodiniaquatilis TaxID=1661150 RepID=A0ABW4JKZ3_9BACL